jgi:membrane protein implicated in regulation of membrane protease activity
MSDTLFALLHLAVLLAILAYAVLSLFAGNTGRGGLLLLLLAVYYLLVLHKAVRKELARRRAR